MQSLSSNPASGRETYTQTIVQTVHAETTPTRSHFPLLPHLLYFFHSSSFLLCVPSACLLTQVWSLIIVLLSVSKQDTLRCLYLSGWSWLSCVNAGSGLTASKPGSHAGLLFLKPGERVQPHRSLFQMAQSAQNDEQVRRGRGEKKKRV